MKSLTHRKCSVKMLNMVIEIPELKEISKKLDRVILLLEKLTGDTGQQTTPPVSVPVDSSSKHLLTVKQIAEYLNISVSTVYGMVSARRFPFLKIGSRVLFDLEAIKRWTAKSSHSALSRSR
jgi:excisionase family DNA binding protein